MLNLLITSGIQCSPAVHTVAMIETHHHVGVRVEVSGWLTCLPWGNGERRSEVSEPQEEDSDSSVVNFRPTLGEAGGRRLHTCAWMCSQMRRNRRMLPGSG